MPSPALLPLPLAQLGETFMRLGRLDAVESALDEAAQVARNLPFPTELAHAFALLARLDAYRGRAAACEEHVVEAHRLVGLTGAESLLAYTPYARGLLALGQGAWAEAAHHLATTRAITRDGQMLDPYLIP